MDRRGADLERREKWATIAIAVAFVSFLPSAVLGYLLWDEVQNRSRDTAALIAAARVHSDRQETQARENRKLLADAARANCESIETVKTSLREIVQYDASEVAQTLKQLGIDPVSPEGFALRRRAKKNADEAVAKLAAIDCDRRLTP